MLTFSNLQVPPPANWQDFESLCLDLWRLIWDDPNTQKNGRQGQPQHGVDIYGRPNQGDKWAGLQCKGKDNYVNKKLTEKEVEVEVKKAQCFMPKLSIFIIATTGPKDAKVEELARKITDNHLEKNLFSVHIFGWNDIVDRLEEYPDLIKRYYSRLSLNAETLENKIDEIKKLVQKKLDNNTEKKILLKSVEMHRKPGDVDISTAILTPEYQAELDDIKNLLNDYKPEEALDRLERLEKRWLNASETIKYQLLTNMARAKLYLNQDSEAAKLLIKAWQFNSEEDKALSNRALGHLLLDQRGQARDYAKKALEKNPASSHAYSILMQTFSDEENLEDIISEIPELYRSTPEVAHTFGHLARKKGDFAEAIKWIEIAIKNDKNDSADLEAELGEVLLQSVMEDKFVAHSRQLTGLQEKQVKKALQLLTSSWEKVVNTKIRDYRVSWIASRGLAKMLLGDLEGAIEDFEVALKAKPLDPTFVMNRAILAYENNDNRTAISLARQILSSEETPGAVLLLARTLREEGESSEAIKILEVFLETNSLEKIKEEAQRLLILLYIDSEDFQNARSLSNSMRAADPTNILYLVDAARISKNSNNHEEAIIFLKKASKYIDSSSSSRELLELADEFFFLQQYENAIKIYEKFVHEPLKTPFTYRLLECYYRSGETGQALRICQTLRQKYGPLKFVSDMEATIYESIGDLEEAKNICKKYLEEFPNDIGMNLRRAVINFRLNNFEKVDEFLDSSINIDELAMEHRFILARLEKDSYEWLRPTKVEKDTAVCIKDESGNEKWYIIEDREDWDILREEINLEHHLARKLMDKSVGDEVLIEESQFSAEYGKIREIKSKYVYACHESISLVPKIFPDISGIWSIKVGSIVEGGKFTEGFQKILDMITSQYETLKKVEQFYREKKIPIGVFAKFIGRNVLDVWKGLKKDYELGINCCFGTFGERDYAASLLEKKPKLIADIVSLMTLHEIGAQDIAIEVFGKLGIAQSTIDLLQYYIDERKNMYSRGFDTIWNEEDKCMIRKITAEEVERDIEILEDIMGWIRKNCEIIPCTAALNMTVENRQKFNDMVGQSFIDTILIASEPENLLYSDDLLLRSFAKAEFGVDGIWTQILLMHSVEKKIIERNEYNKVIIKLACSHYYFTSIDTGILIKAAKQSKWLPSYPYKTVLQTMRGESSIDISALRISAEFIYRLWCAPISHGQRILLIFSLLDVIAEKDPDTVLQRFESIVKRRFSSKSLDESRVISLIDLWKKIYTA
jgi:tetratricopeptide (TPR) repeat protein